MSIPVINFPPFRPYSNITPFTVRDGATYLTVLEELRNWLNTTLVPHVDTEIANLVIAWEDNANTLLTNVIAALNEQSDTVTAQLNEQNASILQQLNGQNAAITAQLATQDADVAAQIDAMTTYVDNAVQSIINSTIEVSDPVISGVISDITSISRSVINQAISITVPPNTDIKTNSELQSILIDNKIPHISGGKYNGNVTLGNLETNIIPENSGAVGINGLIGDGGNFNGGFTINGTIADENGTLVKRNNLAGVRIEGLTIKGNGYPSIGLDLSWIGGSSGNPTLAPANLNILEKIWVEGVKDIAVKLDKFHDSTVQSIVTRDISGPDPIALQMNGPGGWIGIKDCKLYGGRTIFTCQNGQISDTIITHGLEINSASYNHINLDAVHFIDLDEYAILSSGTGNGTKYLVFDSCYFNTINSPGAYIQGRFFRGGVFRNCHFFSGDKLTANISPAAGAGALPVFRFEGCTIGGVTWGTIPAPINCVYEFVNCDDGNSVQMELLRIGPVGYPVKNAFRNELAIKKDSITGAEARINLIDLSKETYDESTQIVSTYIDSAVQDTWYSLPTGNIHNGAFLIIASVHSNAGPKTIHAVTKVHGNAVADIVRLSPSIESTEKIEVRWDTVTNSGNNSIQPELRVTGGTSNRRISVAAIGIHGGN